MDLAEAVHTQTPIDWLTSPHATTEREADAARDAAAWLADHAHHVSLAGPTSAQVLLGWDDLLAGCPGCPDCTPDDDSEDKGDVEDRPAGGLSDDDVARLIADGWLAPVEPVPGPDRGDVGLSQRRDAPAVPPGQAGRARRGRPRRARRPGDGDTPKHEAARVRRHGSHSSGC